MSAMTEFKTLLLSSAPLAALVAGRIKQDKVDQTAGRPFVVFTIPEDVIERSLDGTPMGRRTVFALQCWGDTRQSATAVADEVEAVLAADQRPITSRSTEFEGDLDLEAVFMTVEWLD